MVKIDSALEHQLKNMPNRSVDLIVRTDSDAEPHLEWVKSVGLEVTQVYRLSPGMAVSGPGQAALKLVDQNWVVSIELDAQVKTMGG
jgi:hypothetical protein